MHLEGLREQHLAFSAAERNNDNKAFADHGCASSLFNVVSRVSSPHQKFTARLCSRTATVSDGITAITQRESGQSRRSFHLFFAGICKLMEDRPKVTPPPRPRRARRNDGGQTLCRRSTGSVARQREVDCQRRKQGLCVYPSFLISVTPNPDRNRWSLPLQLCVSDACEAAFLLVSPEFGDMGQKRQYRQNQEGQCGAA